jgi:hypothetical protein
MKKIDYDEIEDLVHEKLGWEKYNFPYTQQSTGDSLHEFSIGKDLLDTDLPLIEGWKNGKENYDNEVVMNYLCHLGFLDEGEYLVKVDC